MCLIIVRDRTIICPRFFCIVSHMQPHFNGQPRLLLTNCKILLPWQILGRWQLPRKGMCRMIRTQVCQGNEVSEGALPYRWALRSEDDAVVCPTMSWHGPRQSRKALILRPREVWGLSLLGRRTHLRRKFWREKNKEKTNKQISCNFRRLG